MKISHEVLLKSGKVWLKPWNKIYKKIEKIIIIIIVLVYDYFMHYEFFKNHFNCEMSPQLIEYENTSLPIYVK